MKRYKQTKAEQGFTMCVFKLQSIEMSNMWCMRKITRQDRKYPVFLLLNKIIVFTYLFTRCEACTSIQVFCLIRVSQSRNCMLFLAY